MTPSFFAEIFCEKAKNILIMSIFDTKCKEYCLNILNQLSQTDGLTVGVCSSSNEKSLVSHSSGDVSPEPIPIPLHSA